ncbi:MAG: DUF1343 domain-containing protein [Sedimentisphaerales bacterium]|nr:DUF1343 domain-containing protein [Sedimentisphaerales bacterium]
MPSRSRQLRLPIVLLIWGWLAGCCSAAMRTGLDNVGESKDLFKGKRVGIIANHTSYNSQRRHIVDVLSAMDGVRVVALFSPEHGVRGTEEAGASVDSQTDPVSGLPVYSLYGQTNKPTPAMLANVDILVFDIQDVGARFYTYLYTMSLAMEAAAEAGKRFVVLDRPDPINGTQIEGEVLDAKFASFVGLYPIPARYGMTVGELARMIDGEGWLANGVRADLVVVPMTGWQRGMWYDQTGLSFIKPSPNMPDLETATVYPGLCLLEGTNVSEGRGTATPFRRFGAPWLNAKKLCDSLNDLHLPGVTFATTTFTPTASKHKDQLCQAVKITVTDRDKIEPFWTGVQIVNAIYRLHRDEFEWRPDHFDRLCGTDAIRQAITAGSSLGALRTHWQARCKTFQQSRAKYLLYRE